MLGRKKAYLYKDRRKEVRCLFKMWGKEGGREMKRCKHCAIEICWNAEELYWVHLQDGLVYRVCRNRTKAEPEEEGK